MTPEQYENAARAVHAALQARTSGRRLHIDRYKKHAARVLNMRAVYPARWDEVIAAGRRLGLFKVDRNTLKKPIFVNLCKGTAPAPVEESTFDEDTSDEPTVEVNGHECRPRFGIGPDEYNINEANMAVLVQYPPGHADHHKGLHVYLECFVSQGQSDDLVLLAKRRGAIIIHVVRAV